MGFDFISQVDPDFASAEQYFADYARQRKLWLAERGGFDAVEDDEGVVTIVEREKVDSGLRATTVIEPRREIEISELGTSPKGLASALAAMGWKVKCWLDVVDVAAKLYVNDSKESDKNQHRAGDVRYEAYAGRRYCIEARFGEHPVGIQAFYLGKGLLDAKDRPSKSASFESCRIMDGAYGILHLDSVDYTRTVQEADEKGWTNERRIQEGMAMNRRYPAEAHLVNVAHYYAADPMNQWVDLYLDLTKTENGGKRLTRKKKEVAPKPDNDLQRMDTLEEWSG